MRLSIKTRPQGCSWTDIEAVWREADLLEPINAAWLFDHFYPIFSDPDGPCFEGWTLLAALLAKTKRLRAGIMVTGIGYRPAPVLANMIATVDHVGRGRL